MIFTSMTLMMLEDELFLENVQKLMHSAIRTEMRLGFNRPAGWARYGVSARSRPYRTTL